MASAVFYEIAQEQHGLVASWQLRAAGLTNPAIRYELTTSGRSDEVAPMVFRLRGSPALPQQRAMPAVLAAGAGAHLAFDSAARLWGWPGPPENPIHVQRAKATNGRKLPIWIEAHESRRLPADHVVVLDGIPVTRPARLLIDQAIRHPPQRIGKWLDWAVNRRQLTGRSVLDVCELLGRRGRPYIASIEAMVNERGVSYVPPASALESRVNDRLRRRGLASTGRRLRRRRGLGSRGLEYVGGMDRPIHRSHPSTSEGRPVRSVSVK